MLLLTVFSSLSHTFGALSVPRRSGLRPFLVCGCATYLIPHSTFPCWALLALATSSAVLLGAFASLRETGAVPTAHALAPPVVVLELVAMATTCMGAQNVGTRQCQLVARQGCPAGLAGSGEYTRGVGEGVKTLSGADCRRRHPLDPEPSDGDGNMRREEDVKGHCVEKGIIRYPMSVRQP